MSYIDISNGLAKLGALREALAIGPETLIDNEVAGMQRTAVELAPRRTGNLAQVLGQPEAIEKSHEGEGKIRWRFGFITKAMQKAAWAPSESQEPGLACEGCQPADEDEAAPRASAATARSLGEVRRRHGDAEVIVGLG